MTFLMHAASAGGCTHGVKAAATPTTTPFNTPGRRSQRTPATPSSRWNATQASVGSLYSEDELSEHGGERDEVCVERWVPMIKTAVTFAKYKLWMPEVRAALLLCCCSLLSRDMTRLDSVTVRWLEFQT